MSDRHGHVTTPLIDDESSRVFSDDDHVAIDEDAGRPLLPAQKGRGGFLGEFLGKYALVLVWALMALFFFVQMPDTFGTHSTFSSIFGSQQVLVFLAMSAMVTLLVGEFDLSSAGVLSLSASIIPVLAGVHGWNIWLACLVGVGSAVLAGVVNAFFVVILDVSSFVVTLGMMTFLIGIGQAVTGTTIVSVNAPEFAKVATQPILGMPIAFYYGIILALLLAYILAWTPLGRSMVFIGANREVARLAGIQVQRIRFGAYVFGAFLSGVAGMLLVATVGGFDPSTAMTYLLPALAAVFLGTAVVQPGSFNPIGTMIALYFLTTGIFGLQLMGYSGWVQNVFYGAGLVVAVAIAKVVRDRSRTA